jgi:hypothetical protein
LGENVFAMRAKICAINKKGTRRNPVPMGQSLEKYPLGVIQNIEFKKLNFSYSLEKF